MKGQGIEYYKELTLPVKFYTIICEWPQFSQKCTLHTAGQQLNTYKKKYSQYAQRGEIDLSKMLNMNQKRQNNRERKKNQTSANNRKLLQAWQKLIKPYQ